MHRNNAPCPEMGRDIRIGGRLSFQPSPVPWTRLMARATFLDELQSKLEQLFSTGPAKDIERNVKTLVGNALSRLDVATREDLDVQTKLIERSTERIAALEARIAELERKLADR